MDVKFGKLSANMFNPSTQHVEENFFASSPKIEQKPKEQQHSSSTRLNDYDSNILENNAYKDMEDEMLKIEHKIGILENSLDKIKKEIEDMADFGNISMLNQLITRKIALEKELMELNKKYGELGLGAKLSGQIASAVNFTSKKKSTTFSRTKDFLSKKVLARISKKFKYSQNMKEALEKLANINSNVDELITMQVPYGETISRYEKLTAYLGKANMLHSRISRNLKEMTE